MTTDKYLELYGNGPSYTGPGELLWLCDILEKYTLGNVLEIGVADGGSMRIWEYLMEPTGLLVGVDVSESSKQQTEELAKVSEKRVEFILGDSTKTETLEKVKGYFPGRIIDFLFIDSDHTYESTKYEYYNYAPMVKPGGIIAFHDVFQRDKDGEIQLGCGWFWRELRANSTIKSDEYVLANGMGVIYI